MRTLDQTTQEVLDLAAKHFQLPTGSLAPEDDFFKKLGIDSLQTLEMLSRLENHFGIELPDYEVQGVSDFKTLAERIQSRLSCWTFLNINPLAKRSGMRWISFPMKCA